MSSTIEPDQAGRWISELRFAPFMDEADGDHVRACEIYLWNSELAGALLETFGHVEVLLRNAVHVQLRSVRPPNSINSWLVDGDLLASRDLERVHAVIARIKQSRKLPTEDRVLAGLTMGFWSGIVGRHYEQLWRDTLRHAFPHGDGTRNQIAGYVNRVVSVRNRVAHHESLLNQRVLHRHEDALALAGTIDPDAEQWLRGLTRVPAVFAARP
jgi:hypothetical protein